jgi:hypothetical protein
MTEEKMREALASALRNKFLTSDYQTLNWLDMADVAIAALSGECGAGAAAFDALEKIHAASKTMRPELLVKYIDARFKWAALSQEGLVAGADGGSAAGAAPIDGATQKPAALTLFEALPPHLFALASEAESAADKETIDQKREQHLDAPDDCEVWLTFGTLRKIERVFATIQAIAAVAKEGKDQ